MMERRRRTPPAVETKLGGDIPEHKKDVLELPLLRGCNQTIASLSNTNARAKDLSNDDDWWKKYDVQEEGDMQCGESLEKVALISSRGLVWM